MYCLTINANYVPAEALMKTVLKWVAAGVVVCGALQIGCVASTSADAPAQRKLDITEASADSGLKGTLTIGANRVWFETQRTTEVRGDSTVVISIGRIYDAHGDSVAAHVSKFWPASRPLSGLTKTEALEKAHAATVAGA